MTSILITLIVVVAFWLVCFIVTMALNGGYFLGAVRLASLMLVVFGSIGLVIWGALALIGLVLA